MKLMFLKKRNGKYIVLFLAKGKYKRASYMKWAELQIKDKKQSKMGEKKERDRITRYFCASLTSNPPFVCSNVSVVWIDFLTDSNYQVMDIKQNIITKVNEKLQKVA